MCTKMLKHWAKFPANSFHSLQTGKHMCTRVRKGIIENTSTRFHSLQTGKHMCTLRKMGKEVVWRSFHSLQTGKHMCTNTDRPKHGVLFVSIPCKRESTCALFTGEQIGPKRQVSIPCKRESTCAQIIKIKEKKC